MKALAFAALVAATPAYAQDCAPLDQMAEVLSGQFGESPAADGIDGNGNLVLIWVNRDTGSWTITVTLPNQITCMVAGGISYETLPAEPNV